MRKNILFLTLFSAILFGFLIMASYGEGEKSKGWVKTHELSRLNGAEVKNLENKTIGRIQDFVINSEGQVTLVILSHDGVTGMGQKVKIVPYALLSFNPEGEYFVLDISREQLVSRPQVLNPKGEKLGEIADFVIDSTGRVAFAILSNEQKTTAVPFGMLKLNPDGDHFIIDISREKLASAPSFREGSNLTDRNVHEIYRYFGQTPYWTTETAI
jgi:sporulation protein YlmC with PRC-barrel domain